MPRFSCVTLGCASLLGEIRYSAVPDRGPYAWHGLALEYRKARHGSKPKDFDEWETRPNATTTSRWKRLWRPRQSRSYMHSKRKLEHQD